jgi:hypothetical protein
MRSVLLKQINNKVMGYFLLILFVGYFGSITFFSHTHIVNGEVIVHSHPYKSQPKNVPFHHNHSKNEFILIHFISNLIAIAPILFLGNTIIRKSLNTRLLILDENFNSNLFSYCTYLPRAPTS